MILGFGARIARPARVGYVSLVRGLEVYRFWVEIDGEVGGGVDWG